MRSLPIWPTAWGSPEERRGTHDVRDRVQVDALEDVTEAALWLTQDLHPAQHLSREELLAEITGLPGRAGRHGDCRLSPASLACWSEEPESYREMAPAFRQEPRMDSADWRRSAGQGAAILRDGGHLPRPLVASLAAGSAQAPAEEIGLQ